MKSKKLIATLTTELRTGFGTIKEALGELSQRVDETNERLEKLSERVDETNGRLDKLSERVDETNGRLDRLTERVDHGFAGLGEYLIHLEHHHDERLKRLEQRDLER